MVIVGVDDNSERVEHITGRGVIERVVAHHPAVMVDVEEVVVLGEYDPAVLLGVLADVSVRSVLGEHVLDLNHGYPVGALERIHESLVGAVVAEDAEVSRHRHARTGLFVLVLALVTQKLLGRGVPLAYSSERRLALGVKRLHLVGVVVVVPESGLDLFTREAQLLHDTLDAHSVLPHVIADLKHPDADALDARLPAEDIRRLDNLDVGTHAVSPSASVQSTLGPTFRFPSRPSSCSAARRV